MSAMTVTSPGNAGQYKVSFGGVLRSEWRKLFSLRSTWILGGIGVVVMLVFAAGLTSILAGFASSGLSDAEMSDMGVSRMFSPELVSQMATSGLQIAALLWATVAVISMAGEYATHSSVSTFSATPRRLPVYVAKALILGVTGFVGGFALHLLASPVVVLFAKMFGLNADIGGGELFTNAALSGVYVLVLTWMGLGAGALMKSVPGAIVTVVVFVYVITSVLQGVSIGVDNDVLRWFALHLPTAALDTLRPVSSEQADMVASLGMPTMEKWDAWLTIGFWGLVPLALGGWSAKVRAVR